MTAPEASPREVISCTGSAGWRLEIHDTAGSTNDLARRRPAWSAVRADVQTGGRGRLGRAFVSDRGGVWLSAVLPAEGGPSRWTGFSLAAGRHALLALRRMGVSSARLRWPNDILAGPGKLAGLLIEQPDATRIVAGIGVNVWNTPWTADPTLVATRLADLLPGPPSVEEVTVALLDAFADAHAEMSHHGLGASIEALNAEWAEPRPVELLLRGRENLHGLFLGLAPSGDLRFRDAAGATRIIPHLDVERLVELDV
jgi:BirA family biotin operon repressor/biotin-[acetyl-CoA-carboxylase] ligase